MDNPTRIIHVIATDRLSWIDFVKELGRQYPNQVTLYGRQQTVTIDPSEVTVGCLTPVNSGKIDDIWPVITAAINDALGKRAVLFLHTELSLFGCIQLGNRLWRLRDDIWGQTIGLAFFNTTLQIAGKELTQFPRIEDVAGIDLAPMAHTPWIDMLLDN